MGNSLGIEATYFLGEKSMNASDGQQRFENWREDPRINSFASRLLVRWLQWRCGCTQKVAITAVRNLPEEGTLDDLVVAVASLMGARDPEQHVARN